MTFSRIISWLGVGSAFGVALGWVVSATAMDAYWTEPAYSEFPLRGPTVAKGLVIWNSGVKGTMTTNQYPPPLLIAGLAARGWDVIKLDRNPTYENTWSNAGLRHVDRLVEEAEKAQKSGYRRLILGGQSFGAAIALQAADTFPAFAVVAVSPSIGTSARWFGSVITEADSHAIEQHTYEQVEGLKAERAVFVMSPDDELAPNIDRAPHVRELMAAKPGAYMLIDRQVHGHGGGYTPAFTPFASCAQWLLDPDLSPKPGEFHCYRDEIPAMIGALGVKRADAVASWFGYIVPSGEPLILFLRHGTSGSTVDFSFERGLGANSKASVFRDVAAIEDNGTLRFTLGSRKAEAFVQPDGANMKLTYTIPGQANVWTATLVPMPPGS